MKLVTQIRYGIRILLDLTMHQEEGVVQMGDIASRQNISLKYLENIIRSLKKAGFVISKRGRNGGHTLAHPPHTISLAHIVKTFEPEPSSPKLSGATFGYPDYQDMLIQDAWSDAKEAFYNRLEDITLADLSANTTKQLWQNSDLLIFCD